jgi:hypothetical protein
MSDVRKGRDISYAYVGELMKEETGIDRVHREKEGRKKRHHREV